MWNTSAATSNQTEGFYGFEIREKIYSSLGFMFYLWGCKEVRVEYYCYDTRLWLEIVDEWIKNVKLKDKN